MQGDEGPEGWFVFRVPEQQSGVEPVILFLLQVMSHCQEEPLSRHSGGTGWSTGPFQAGIRD